MINQAAKLKDDRKLTNSGQDFPFFLSLHNLKNRLGTAVDPAIRINIVDGASGRLSANAGRKRRGVIILEVRHLAAI